MAAYMRTFCRSLSQKFSVTKSIFINNSSIQKQLHIEAVPDAVLSVSNPSTKDGKRFITSGFSSQQLAHRTFFNMFNSSQTSLNYQQSRSISTSAKLDKYYVQPNYLKKWARRDVKRRELFAEHEYERSSLRMIKKSDILPMAVKKKAAEDIDKLPRDSCITKVRNRCVLTDRGRGIVCRYRVSRIMFRYYADRGEIAGVTRASW